jgi:hypothetical protein
VVVSVNRLNLLVILENLQNRREVLIGWAPMVTGTHHSVVPRRNRREYIKTRKPDQGKTVEEKNKMKAG